jgi:dTDP-4-amino-4,6-dideoxygalactose transaminase
MNVPFLDLKAPYLALKSEIDSAIQSVCEKTAFASGPFVADFENAFAEFCGCKHAVGVGSGTEALWLTLLAMGIGQGDEVITAPNTFIATAEAISFCGATPVFVDVDDVTYTMNPALLRAAITPRTRAIIPVHLFGQPADMDRIVDIANESDLMVIEDACQAHGAEYKGRRAGSLAHAGCFSFYPGKNLGAFGEAGAVTTDDDELATRIRQLRDHGQSEKYIHSSVGWNARMDGIQGAVLGIKLPHLAAGNEARRRNAALYGSLLEGIEGLTLPHEAEYAKHIYHVYAIRSSQRDALRDALTAAGIGCGMHYPIPVHLQIAYQDLGLKQGTYPISERCAEEYLSLPMFPELTEEQIRFVAGAVAEALAQTSVDTAV